MPITQAAKKAQRQTERRTARNKKTKRAMKDAIKAVRKAVEAGNTTQARELLPTAYKKIDKAAKNGIIHKNNAARKKSRLTQQVNKAEDN